LFDKGTLDSQSAVGTFLASDFDQGAVDGRGHDLVAGDNGITFIDYRTSHGITHPDYTITVFGFDSFDDVAPLSGVGSQTPEPANFVIWTVGSGTVCPEIFWSQGNILLSHQRVISMFFRIVCQESGSAGNK